MENWLEFLANFNGWQILIGGIVFVLTGIIKLPIKYWARKTQDSGKITKYITFLPLFLSFGISVLFFCLRGDTKIFNDNFFTMWLSSASISLALYAIYEKFIPNRQKILSEVEIEQNNEVIEKIRNWFSKLDHAEEENEISPCSSTSKESNILKQASPEVERADNYNNNKIILRGKNDIASDKK